MSSEIHILAILTPIPGKEDRIKEFLTGVAEKVYKNEPDCSQYHVFEQVNSESVNVIVLEETYKDQATVDAHFRTEYFQALGKMIKEEGLVSAPLDLKFIKPFTGFASR